MTDPKHSFVARYEAFAEGCATWGARLAAVALMLICVLVIAEIVSRNLLNTSTMIVDEMCGYLNVAVVFLGLAYTMQQRGFIRVELAYNRFKGIVKHTADWISVILSLLYSLVVLYYMSKYAIYSYKNELVSAELTRTPLFIPQSVLVFGALLLTLYLFKFIVNRCKDVP